ncbi:MAG TPA: DoxX family protein [Pseudolabrys sp.]|jgi:putative oxidoreductase|nr:DoxX family protein [Pseudolabrys sp.]
MTDIAAIPQAAQQSAGAAAMSRLADRLAAVTPPAYLPQPSPAVQAALATSKAIAERAALNARRSRSLTGAVIEGFVAVCSLIPYAFVAFGLRLLMARMFFIEGQTRIDGPHVAYSVYGFDFSAVLPAQVRPETVADFLHYTTLPIPPVLAAYLVSYGEFILPVMLLIGLGTRFAAVCLLLMTAFFHFYVMPEALWSTDIYWGAILLVLISNGPGVLSLDHFLKLARRS